MPAASYTGGNYFQNFDNLFTTVPNNDTATILASVLPTGWTFLESGTNANTNLRVHTGSVTAGDTILFGATGSNERALGSFASGSLTSIFGLEIANNTGNTLTQFTINYTGEQWRDGRGAGAVQNITAFSYGIGNSAINSGTFTPVTNLNLVGPGGTQTGTDIALDGNLSANQTSPNFTVTGISWTPGQSLWLRWSDSNDTGNDDGLAIDNVSFSTTPLPDFTVNLSDSPDPVTAGSPLTYTLTVNNNGTANASSVTVNYTLPSGVTFNNTTVSNGFTASQSGNTVTFSNGSINAGTNATLTVNVTPTTIGTLTSGTATVDPNNTITESNESNNTAAAITTTVRNSAPVLNNTGNPTLTAITEDLAANNPGTLVSDIIGNAISDPNPNALKGIAVTYVDNSNATWQYTLDGNTWINFNTPSLTTARLLPANSTTRIRLLPNANFGGNSDISFYAWDQTTGTAGNTANILPTILGGNGTGGTTAFSTAYEGASISVTPVNDTAPTLTTGTSALQNIDEDTSLISNRGSLLANLVNGLISDSDIDPQGIAVTGVDNSNGQWQYSVDGGANWTDFGTVSNNSATVLSTGIKLYDGSLNSLPTSQGWLKFGASAALPPVLGIGGTESLITGGTRLNSTTTPAVSPFTSLTGAVGYNNYNSYTPVLFNQSFPELDPIKGFTISFDVRINSDQNASDDNGDGILDRAGFSVTVVTKDNTKAIELGFWTNEIWARTAVPLFTHSTTERAFRDTSAAVTRYDLVIENNTYKLFVPGLSTPILTGALRDYTAFDHTVGLPSPINSLPFDPYETPNFLFFGDNTTSATAISDLTRVELQTNTRVRFIPNANYNGQANLTFRAWDGSDGVATGTTGVNAAVNGNATPFSSNTRTAAITINSVNDTPTVANLIPDQAANQNTPFNFQFAANTFNDIDINDTLTYTATLENGNALPGWLTFNPANRTFNGTPPTVGNFNVRVTATDVGSASVSDVFALQINNGIQGTSGGDTLTGTPNNDTINGLDGNDRLIGLAGDDTLDGGAGNDYIFGGAGNDNIIGGDGNDLLYGEAGNDTINGGAGNDNLNGGAGNDILNGGLGDDIYTIDAGDILTENANEGTDTVNADFTYTLGNNFENLTLTGNAAINGTGNALNNQIFGNNAINTLNGGDGNDWLLGKGGNDILNGGNGNDRLDGGLGNDQLTGGAGNDLYQVDSLDDVIIEAASEGTDTVSSSVNWTLGNNLENLTLIGSQAINGTGNTLNNRLQGNAANNILSGLGGNDYLAGNNGNDTLIGGVGNDILVGGSGLDDFDFATTRTGGFDTVLDFNVNDDTILLSRIEFGLTQSPGVLDAASFFLGSIATNATQRFIYNQTQGTLWFDSDGNGSNAAVQIGAFSNRAALSNADFEVS